MEQNLKKAMQNSISEVLGTMFYMPLEFDPDETLSGSRLLSLPDIQASILCFDGPFSGCLVMLVPGELLALMTADFMGEREVSAMDMEGTLKEITNMVAGNTFSNYDCHMEFCLGIPEIIDAANGSHGVFSRKGIFLMVESVDGPLGVWMGLGA
ncbi:chemotaxis phosphatase CheX-like protein [Desulfobotulus alkaliphilus]|uniref:Chemotaxis phosphatase CheX-like protein n=1 Tax=Desulfobotulus alkaliphilus TaxID=622671 RepID=A0A562R519_9BACT|nr:chemotaxis protein CheX [Desulfobotulus alkaliphilus]TWI63933.1 chemotaxis phosphatase CheX-like protein [Desulfobotulus alkaliphilus]